MFRKKDEERRAAEASAQGEETAYEDNWYRSLKALSERQDDGPTVEEEVTEAPAAVSLEIEAPLEAPLDTTTTEVAPPTDIEARAGRLLERLRSLQRLGDEVQPNQENPSVSGG